MTQIKRARPSVLLCDTDENKESQFSMQQERWHCGNRKGLKKQLDFEQVFKSPAHPSKAISKSSAQWSSDETPHSVPTYPIDCRKNIGKKIEL